MPYFEILVTLGAVQLAAVASPGVNLIYVTTAASSGSKRSAFLAVAGILLGAVTWTAATALGLSAVVTAYPLLSTALRYAGTAYLLWLGARLLFNAFKNEYREIEAQGPKLHSARSIVLGAFFLNMSNPKLVAYYGSLFSVMIPADAPSWLLLAAAGIVVGISACWWSLVALVFTQNRVRRFLVRARRSIDMIMGGGLLLLAVLKP